MPHSVTMESGPFLHGEVVYSLFGNLSSKVLIRVLLGVGSHGPGGFHHSNVVLEVDPHSELEVVVPGDCDKS